MIYILGFLFYIQQLLVVLRCSHLLADLVEVAVAPLGIGFRSCFHILDDHLGDVTICYPLLIYWRPSTSTSLYRCVVDFPENKEVVNSLAIFLKFSNYLVYCLFGNLDTAASLLGLL